ncbi:Failed axon connections-like protein [Aphelenchoides besseyi]|nr:Failed axon connections-like protein [Aphelenchoides besseyi]
MNVFQMAQDVWAANEKVIHTTIDLGQSMFNKMTDIVGLTPKQQAVIPAAPPIQITTTTNRWPQMKNVIVVGIVSLGVYYIYRRFRRQAHDTFVPYVERFEADVVYVFQFPRSFALPNLSPYALKLETWLRFADINYKVVEDLSLWHRSSEGTLPYVEMNGEEIVDSANIIDVLPMKLKRKSTEMHLTVEQKAVVRAFDTMIEMSLNYCTAKYRYEHISELLQLTPPHFGALQPIINLILRFYLPSMAAKKIRSMGIGKHSDALIEKISFSDLQALSDQLGSQHYLTGVKPTRVDATAFSALALILYVPFNTPQRGYINEHCPNLRDYCDRIRNRYWPDWVECTALLKNNTDWKRRRPASRAPSSVY